MSEAAARLAAVRAVRSRRGGAPRTADRAYVVYASVLVLAVLGAPAVLAVEEGLSRPDVLALLTAPSAGRVLAAATGLLLAALVLLGQVRGPAVTTPFLTAAVVGTDLPRRTTLRRATVTSVAVVTVALVTVAGLLARVLHDAGVATTAVAWTAVLTATLLGPVAGAAWLLGQRTTARRANVLAGTVAVLAAAPALVPSFDAVARPGWFAAAWPATAVAAVLAALAVPRLLDALTGAQLLTQARRWEGAGGATSGGDVASALAQLRPPPRGRRRWRAVHGRSPVIRFFVRDLVGALRTPERCITACLALLFAGTLLGVGLGGRTTFGGVLIAVGALTAHLALGVFSDGFRHAVEASAAPALYGHGTGQLIALHAVLPGTAGVLLTGVGAAATAGLGPWSAIVAALVGLVVLARLYDTTKGPLPAGLLTPVPTPFGDGAGVAILVWQVDAVALSVTVAVVAGALTDVPAALVLVAVAAGATAAALRRRLRRS